jgi:hypothetical protein
MDASGSVRTSARKYCPAFRRRDVHVVLASIPGETNGWRRTSKDCLLEDAQRSLAEGEEGLLGILPASTCIPGSPRCVRWFDVREATAEHDKSAEKLKMVSVSVRMHKARDMDLFTLSYQRHSCQKAAAELRRMLTLQKCLPMKSGWEVWPYCKGRWSTESWMRPTPRWAMEKGSPNTYPRY